MEEALEGNIDLERLLAAYEHCMAVSNVRSGDFKQNDEAGCEQSYWDLPNVVLEITRRLSTVQDVCSVARVGRAWRQASEDPFIWKRFIERGFGRSFQPISMPQLRALGSRREGQPAVTADGNAHRRLYVQLATFQPTTLVGWAEDLFTSAGAPYAMNLSLFIPDATGPGLRGQRTMDAISTWAYLRPAPRTRVKVVVCKRQKEVPKQPQDMQKRQQQLSELALVGPEFAAAAAAAAEAEDERLLAAAPGSILRGSEQQPDGSTSSIAASNAAAAAASSSAVASPAAAVAAAVSSHSSLQEVATGPGGLPLYHRRVRFVEYEKLPESGPVDVPTSYFGFCVGPVVLGTLMPGEVPLHRLNLTRPEQMLGCFALWPQQLHTAAPELRGVLQAGQQYSGTVVTNYQGQLEEGGRLRGTAHVGEIQITVRGVQMQQQPASGASSAAAASSTSAAATTTGSTTTGSSSGADPVAYRAVLCVTVPARTWRISAQGVPQPFDPEDDFSYAGAVSELVAEVEVTQQGRMAPVDKPRSWRPEPSDLSTRMLLIGDSRLRTSAVAADLFSRGLLQRQRLSCVGVASGGVLAGLLVHPVLGRAAFAAMAPTV